MTVQQAINKFLNWWLAQVGYHEGKNNWNKYAEVPGISKLYGWKPQNEPYCDTAYDAGMIECFGLENASKLTYQPIGKGSAACRYSAKFYKDNNAWYTKNPQPGDQIFFYSGGEINHTGVVEKVSGGLVHTIEANTSDQVMKRVYAVGISKIAGYGRPNWSVVTDQNVNDETGSGEIVVEDPAPIPEVKEFSLSFHYLSKGAGMGDLACLKKEVRSLQQLLIAHGYTCGGYGDDGEFGPGTEQSVRNYQYNNGLEVDGEVGPETRASLEGVSNK